MLHQKRDATMYRQMIGSLMYMTNTILDICFAVNTLSQFLTDPRQVHLIVAKHISRYLRGTVDYGPSMRRIKRLTWGVMWIRIGQAVSLIKRALRGAASAWDQREAMKLQYVIQIEISRKRE